MNIIGIAGLAIDASSALIQNNSVVVAIEEERLKRIKHASIIQSGGLPYESLNACLKFGNISFKDVDHVGYFFQPYREFLSMSLFRLRRSYLSPSTFAYYQTGYLEHLRKHIAVDKLLQSQCKNKMKFHHFSHHLTHAASVYYPSPFEESAILVIDAMSEFESTTFYYAKGNHIKRLLKYNFPNSLGFLYATMTDYLGFKSNNDEYKVMGLASYGNPTYYDKLKKVININSNGEIKINYGFFSKYFRGREYFNEKFISEFGPKRLPGDEISERHTNIASSIQKILEESVMKMLIHLKKITGSKNICLSGGVALNCKMNGKILKEGPFENIFLQPAPHDAGCSIGSALLVKHNILQRKERESNLSPYLGLEFNNIEIKKTLEESNIKYKYCEDISLETANKLSEGKLVAWFQGRNEWGPRALGSRSILADPTRKEMKNIINKKVKHREEFRPFAPSVTLEDAHKFFDIKIESPFMLFVVPVLDAVKEKIPSVVHVDGTARPQTVNKKDNPLFHELLKNFEKIKGVPVLLNTSFNINKEPIVNSPRDALRCFFSTGLDCLVMGNFLIDKKY